jgi:hypothetical protein
MIVLFGIRSLVGFGKARAPLVHPVLYPREYNMTLYLNRFRGEPAITRLDWPFTPSHNSSRNFSTLVGSVLQLVLPNLQPGHG